MTTPIYAIGDIHGQAEMLDHTLDLILRDGGPGAPIVFLGDYTDRGPDSKGVLDRLIDLKARHPNWVFLKGNHDVMFEGFLREVPYHDPHLFVGLDWLNPRLGGTATLQSYGVDVHEKRRFGWVHDDARKTVPQSHIDFINGCQMSFETDDLFFVHAGIRPEVPLSEQTDHDLMWIREDFNPYTKPHPKLIVHGHTALDAPTHFGNRVDLDGGAGYGHPIVPAVFEGTTCWTLTPSGRKDLTAPCIQLA